MVPLYRARYREIAQLPGCTHKQRCAAQSVAIAACNTQPSCAQKRAQHTQERLRTSDHMRRSSRLAVFVPTQENAHNSSENYAQLLYIGSIRARAIATHTQFFSLCRHRTTVLDLTITLDLVTENYRQVEWNPYETHDKNFGIYPIP